MYRCCQMRTSQQCEEHANFTTLVEESVFTLPGGQAARPSRGSVPWDRADGRANLSQARMLQCHCCPPQSACHEHV